MCGRYSETAYKKELMLRFKCQITEGDFSARYNIAPMSQAPVVVIHDSRNLKSMQWGLVPHWAKESSIGNKMINARAETLAQKPSFKKSFERRRCLIPADGFYEWQKVDGSKTKVPMRIVLKSREPFAFAGLWDTWQKPDGRELQSFTIITTGPNELMRPIHNRMPVILHEKAEDTWLDSDFKDTSKLSELLVPYPMEEMETYEVSPLVNSPRNDMPECIAPIKNAMQLF